MTTPRPGPVQFRPDPVLAANLAERTDGASPGLVADRDLARYYQLLDATLSGMRLSEREAMLLVDATRNMVFDPTSERLLWAELDVAIRDRGLSAQWGIDGAELVRAIRDGWTPAERIAVIDALERFWSSTEGDARPILRCSVQAMGLVH